ncbi:beta-galactosidase trimerization domain-containing protein [Microbacterium sp. M28]|uniref:alpha-amylase family protein n=1 Tax=Microbacterium sp. M28 TaxID=2962064 RepID=UPI0021F48D21|nr:beta-galactosidase trimerization domain-containing protein [Microbacterium sp. M28]UYO97394.1 beta-galactosidase trimerization domain-containing protein [Microbacterium sp. M28]
MSTVESMSIPSAAAVDIERAALPWYERAMRWAQLTMVGDDPRPGSGFDPGFWIDYMRDIRADAACLNAGGYMAFYPSDVEGHYRSPYLGDSDPFGDLVRGARDLGLVVMARIDSHAVHGSVAALHPEWLSRDRDGEPQEHWSAPNVWLTCPFGTYATEFVPRVITEILERYDVDAIFANRWTGEGRCFCDGCRAQYRDASGGADIPPLPTRNGGYTAEEIRYRQWWERTLLGIARTWDEQIRALKPEARFVPNSGGGALSAIDMSALAAQSEILFADKQARSGLSPAFTSGRHAKEFRAVMGNKPVGGIFSMGIEEAHRWKDSVQVAEEIRMWVASATANGVRAWFTKFAGTVHDTRWLDVVKSIYLWHAENERYLRNTRSIADIGLVYSQQSARAFDGAESERTVQRPILGWYQMLVEARMPFDMVHDQLLDAAALQKYRVLILPNTVAMSDRQADQLREFVARGGTLVATYRTSLLDEHGRPRKDFALGDQFGVSAHGVRTDISNSYLRLRAAAEGDGDAAERVLRGITGTDVIINSANRVEVTVRDDRDVSESISRTVPVTLIDSYPDLPMEDVYRRDTDESRPQLVLSQVGAGRVAYFANDIDRAFSDFLVQDHFELMRGVLDWARDAAELVSVRGGGVIEVVAWEQSSSMTVHLVNMTNPRYLKGPIVELLPSPEQLVSIAIPEGRRVRQVRLLRSDADADALIVDGRVELTIDSVLDFEVIAIDLEELTIDFD